MNQAMCTRRQAKDIMKLKTSKHKIDDTNEQSTYHVEFHGPKQTPYESGIWTINLYLPAQYPYKSPSIGFSNKIFHPNIDFMSGSVCLDVINQTWTPMYELLHIFQIFLPQLLSYPNPHSPLNHDAAKLFEKDIKQYNSKVRQYVNKYAFLKIEVPKQVIKIKTTTTKAPPSNQIESDCSLSDIQDADDMRAF